MIRIATSATPQTIVRSFGFSFAGWADWAHAGADSPGVCRAVQKPISRHSIINRPTIEMAHTAVRA